MAATIRKVQARLERAIQDRNDSATEVGTTVATAGAGKALAKAADVYGNPFNRFMFDRNAARAQNQLDKVQDTTTALKKTIQTKLDNLSKLDPNSVVRGIADSSRRYGIPNRLVAEDVSKQISRLEPLLDQHNIKILEQLDQAPTNASGARRFGNFDPETRTITLFEGATDVTRLEELHHLERAIKGGWLGKATPPSVIAEWETRFQNLLRNLGVELLD